MKHAVVLGGGRLPKTGELTDLSKERLFAAAQMFKTGKFQSISVMGGQKSSWRRSDVIFKQSGADLKAEFLIECDVPDNAIRRIYGDTSDTISEAFVFYQESSTFNDVIVVTSTLHLPRSLYLFRNIGGKDIQITGYGVEDSRNVLHESEEGYYFEATRSLFESKSLLIYKTWEQWRLDQEALYEEFSKIRQRYAATELTPSEAYNSSAN